MYISYMLIVIFYDYIDRAFSLLYCTCFNNLKFVGSDEEVYSSICCMDIRLSNVVNRDWLDYS